MSYHVHEFLLYLAVVKNPKIRSSYLDLCIITSTADELSGGTNIDDLERP